MKIKALRWFFFGICVVFSLIFNLAAWMSADFSDYYTNNIFMRITPVYGRFTSLFPFSVGEMMLVFLVVMAVVFVIYLILLPFSYLSGRKRAVNDKGGLQRLTGFLGGFYLNVLTILVPVVMVIMTINCFVLYHCSPLRASEKSSYHDLEELSTLRDYIVTKCNDLSLQFPRDESGCIIYEGDMDQSAKEAMAGIYDGKNRLNGFFVTPKALLFSGFMSQQNMQGYYFPFSMEANYNDDMYIMNKPFTMCHELAHTHGYIYEDEANFLGYLACINSDDPIFVYSGYLGVLNYVNNDYYRSVGKEEYASHVEISELVRFDDQFLTKEAWDKVEKEAVLDTETVKKAADTFIDTNLKVNGVSSGKASYSHVVALLLDYYGEGDRYEK